MISNHLFRGALLVTIGSIVIGCGGSVDLEHHSSAGGSSAGGASASLPVGFSGQAGALDGVGGSGISKPASGGTSGALAMGGDNAGGASLVNAVPGAWLAYDGQNEGEKRGIYLVYVLNGGICHTRLTPADINAKQPAFSNDGALLAYVSDVSGSQQIYALDLVSGVSRQLTNLKGGASYPAFSPSGNALVFVSGDPEAYRDGSTPFSPDLGEVLMLDMKTLATQTLLTRDPVLPPWSAPAFAGSDRILTANGRQLEAIYLLNGAFDDRQTVSDRGAAPQDPAPSADGERVTFVDKCGTTSNLYTMRLDGSQAHTCDSTPLVASDFGYRSPDWGSVGFLAVEFDRPERGLWLYDPVNRVTDPGVDHAHLGRNPAWSPPTFTHPCTQ